jgi:PAS domain S-box-containing protein
MSQTGHMPELESLRSQVADLTRALAEQDRSLRAHYTRLAQERARADAELRRQLQQLSAVQALAHVGGWEWDIASGEMEWSDEQFRIFGHEPQSMSPTHETFLTALLPEDHDRILASVNEALRGTAPYNVECRIVLPNGEVRTIHCRGEVDRDADGRPVRMFGSTLDITERKQAEAALQQSEAHFRELIEHSSDIITVLDLDGTIRFESPSFERLLGYAAQELNGRVASILCMKMTWRPSWNDSRRSCGNRVSPGPPNSVSGTRTDPGARSRGSAGRFGTRTDRSV